jgi:pimeloyl-ACP methyl ester carboxylesterase
MGWVKKGVVAASGLLALVAGSASAEDATGDWVGLLAGQYHVVLHVAKDPAGHYSATLESPDQGAFVLTVDEVAPTLDHLGFSVSKIGAHYSGVWNPAAKGWVGTWTQGMTTRLILNRMTGPGSALAPPKRPQEDAIARGPLPYTSAPVRFANSAAPGVTLGGTFSKPAGTGPFPTVVLIAGSGPNGRDEALMGHKLFLVLADGLNRRGIAVLRYDKRGVGESTGTYGTATTADFTSDAAAALAWLKTRADVDPKRIGVLGHSEGGLIAPAVAVADPSVSFVVLMAGPGVRGDALFLKQMELISRANGSTEVGIAKTVALSARGLAVIEASSNIADARAKLKARAAQAVAAGVLTREQADRSIAKTTDPWMYAFLRYDPLPTLRKVRVPVLAINGSLDLQVEPKTNLAGVKAALADDADVTVAELPGLNHLFQDAKTGSPNEYGDIEETMAPVALKAVSDWVVAHTS